MGQGGCINRWGEEEGGGGQRAGVMWGKEGVKSDGVRRGGGELCCVEIKVM